MFSHSGGNGGCRRYKGRNDVIQRKKDDEAEEAAAEAEEKEEEAEQYTRRSASHPRATRL